MRLFKIPTLYKTGELNKNNMILSLEALKEMQREVKRHPVYLTKGIRQKCRLEEYIFIKDEDTLGEIKKIKDGFVYVKPYKEKISEIKNLLKSKYKAGYIICASTSNVKGHLTINGDGLELHSYEMTLNIPSDELCEE